MKYLYFPKSHYNGNFKTQLFPILKPFLKGEKYLDKEGIKAHGVSKRDFDIVKQIEKADIVVKPMSCNYYIMYYKLDQATEVIREVRLTLKTIWRVILSAIGFKWPFYEHVIRQKNLNFHNGLFKSEFEALFSSYRKLWNENLGLGGFFKLQKTINELI